MTYQTKSDLILVFRDLKMTYQAKSDLIEVLRDLKMTYQTKSDIIQVVRDLNMTYQTKLDLIQVLRDLKMTCQTESGLIQVLRDLKMTHQTKSDLIQVVRDLTMTYQTKLDLIQVLRDLKMTYQTKSDLIQVLGDLKMTYQTKSDLIQVLRDLKMTYQTRSDLIQVLRDLKMTCQTESGLIQVLRDLKMTLGTKISAHPPHPYINMDGQFLAPIRAPMPATLALHKNAPEHVSSAATHNQTNNLSEDAGPNSLALFQKMPTPSSPAMVVRGAAPARYPANPGMPAGPYESPSTRTPEKQIQGTKERPTVIAFLGKWKRGFAIKTVISTTIITNKDRTYKYTTFKKWKLYTRLGVTTTNLNAHTVRTSLTEALCKWRRLLSAKNKRHITKKLACALTARLETQEKNTLFKEWWLHTTDISAFHHLHVQLFLKGLASEIHTITGPYLVTRRQLHETIAEITSIPPQEQHLASIHNHADTHNADLLYMEKGTTLQLLLHLKGDSGSSRPSSIGPHKHAKPLTHQTLKFHICVNGPDQHHNAFRVLPNDKIDQLNESLEERVDPPPSYQTLFRHRQQLDDDLRPDSSNSDEMNDDDDKSPTNGKAGAAAHPPL